MNKSTTLAMRTSEITAQCTILGAVATAQAQSELALSFDAVKQRVRDEFDMWVLGLESIDLFDLVVIIGSRNAGFINDLVDFAC